MAETDALKRACRLLGEVTGNCLWSQDYLQWVRSVTLSARPVWSKQNLYRDDMTKKISVEKVKSPPSYAEVEMEDEFGEDAFEELAYFED